MDILVLLRVSNIVTSFMVVIVSTYLVFSSMRLLRTAQGDRLRNTGAVVLSMFMLMVVTGLMNIVFMLIALTDTLSPVNNSIIGSTRILIENVSTFLIMITFAFIKDGKL